MTTITRQPTPSPLDDRTGVRGFISRNPLRSFFVLALALSWLAWTPYILSPHGLGLWNIHFPGLLGSAQFSGVLPGALLGPLGSAFLVTAIADGRPGLRRWVGRLGRWRVAWYWYAIALVGVPALIVGTGFLFSGGDVRAPGALTLVALVPGLIIQLFTTGLSEEPGWRDFAAPRLQSRYGALGTAAILGPIWALWHMPLYLSDWGGWPNAHWTQPLVFALFTITFNVVMIFVFNKTGESLPLAMLLHVGVNNTISTLWAAMYPGLTVASMMIGLTIMSTIGAVVLLVVTRGKLGYPRAGRPVGSPDGSR